LATATIPLHSAAEEAWMSIKRPAADAAPIAVPAEYEKQQLGAWPLRRAVSRLKK